MKKKPLDYARNTLKNCEDDDARKKENVEKVIIALLANMLRTEITQEIKRLDEEDKKLDDSMLVGVLEKFEYGQQKKQILEKTTLWGKSLLDFASDEGYKNTVNYLIRSGVSSSEEKSAPVTSILSDIWLNTDIKQGKTIN